MNQCSQNIPKCLVYPLINNICSMIAAMYVVVGVSFYAKIIQQLLNLPACEPSTIVMATGE